MIVSTLVLSSNILERIGKLCKRIYFMNYERINDDVLAILDLSWMCS